MDLEELKSFLLKFNLDENTINDLVRNKILFEKNQNLFLIDKEMRESEVYNGFLCFVYLKQLIVSKFLLDFILENKGNFVLIKSEKKALDFTYGSDLVKESIQNISKGNLVRDKFYLVIFEGNILGYCEFVPDKKFQFRNLMNIGEYLREI